ncbi:MAG TPA: ribonuclease P protein component [Candidatus Brocadiia bacterium]|nr:ribonuclease P protein component [Candidatus Brocadiia bacterium]
MAKRSDSGSGMTARRDFPPDARIRLKRDFAYAFAEGTRVRLRLFTAVVVPGNGQRSRLGLVIGRKVDRKAHRRNRIRRRLREGFRHNQSRIAGIWDIVVLAGAGCLGCPWSELQRDFDVLIGRIQAMSEEGT